MIYQVHQCIILGLAVMLLNAGDAAALQKPSISVSCRKMTLFDLINLKCVTESGLDLQCSFRIHSLNTFIDSINITHSQGCELHVNGTTLIRAGAPGLEEVWTEVEVSCTVTNGSEHTESNRETITVWKINLPMTYIITGLAGVGALILIVWVCLCVLCIISLHVKGTSHEMASPRTGCEISEKCVTEEQNLNPADVRVELLSDVNTTEQLLSSEGPDEDSDPQEKDENEEPEEELCYATVLHPGVSENSVHAIRFSHKTEYAVVVINSN